MKVFLARNLQTHAIPDTMHLALDTAKLSVKAQIAQSQGVDPLDESEWVNWIWIDRGDGLYAFGTQSSLDKLHNGEGFVQEFEVLP